MEDNNFAFVYWRNCLPLSQESLRIETQNPGHSRNSRSPCFESGPMDFSNCFHGIPMENDLFTSGQTGYAGLISREGDGNEMLFHDPAQVQQWAASSAVPPATTNERDVTEDMSRDASQWSTFQSAEVADNGPIFSPFSQVPLRTGSPGSASTSTGASVSLFDTNETFENFHVDSGLPYDTWQPSDNQAYDNSISTKDAFRSTEASNKMCLGSQEYWVDGPTMSQEDLHGCPGLYAPGQATWSSPSTTSVEPSLASSYSQGALFPGTFGSPACLSAHEDLSSTASMDEPVLSPLALGPAQNLYGTDASQSCDAASTLRPTNGFQRPSLPFWNPNENFHLPLVHPTEYYGMPRRPSSDGENTARRNELYQVGPKDDGLYHCPFAATEGCTHKPEKLKCNYDKHLDAHLKPYRCKDLGCADVPFSSTACLLRHEREAHGMHGHGDKPYLCTYEDCDRAVPGNGFPRRWNLQDHMKRVHDYTGPPTGEKASSTDGANSRISRKKKAASAGAAPSRRTKTGTITKPVPKASLPARQRQSIQKNMQDQVVSLPDQMDFLDVNDPQGQDHLAMGFSMHDNSMIPLDALY